MGRILLAGIALAACGTAWAGTDGESCSCGHADDNWAWNPAPYAGAALGMNAFEQWSAVEAFDDGSFVASRFRFDQPLGGIADPEVENLGLALAYRF